MAAEMKRIRSGTGLSQPKFAAHVTALGGDLKEGTLAAIESGRRNMSDQAVDRLAGALSLSDRDRARLHRARRKQMALDLEAGTARRVAALEERLAELEQRMSRLEEPAGGSYGRITARGVDDDGVVIQFDTDLPHAADLDHDGELASRSESPSEFD